MPIEIIDCEQGTPEWFRARLGLPTASEFATIQATGRGGGESKTRHTYLMKLAGEIITGEPAESYTNPAMERGKVMEAEARAHYAYLNDAPTQQVGFIRNGRKGCSPDALLGERGLLEIKTKAAHILGDLLLADVFPPEHVAQCQGAMWVAEREWIDLACYWPRMPLFVKRLQRDELYIAKLAREVDRFNDELNDVVERLRLRSAA